jgi:membrane protein implicated in regulation of membrane protease activity
MYWGFGMAYRVLRDALSGPLLHEGRVDHVEERMVGERIQYAELVLTSGDQTWRIAPPPRVSVGDTVRVSYLAGTEQVCDLWVRFIPLPEG